MDSTTSLQELLDPVTCQVTWKGSRLRPLHPFEEQDRILLEAIGRGEFTINGVRNKDLQPLLYSTPPPSGQEARRRSAAVSRKLRLLRAHGLINKVPATHRYQVTANGRQIITAIATASRATVNLLIPKAA